MHTPRRATPDDVEALVRLRALTTDGVDDGRWRSAAGWWFAERLDHDDDFAAFVIEHDHRVVAGAAGHCVRGAPSPDNPTGVLGYVFDVAAEPPWQRQGLASACVESLITWFISSTRAGVLVLEAAGLTAEVHRRGDLQVSPLETVRLVLPRD